jgi:hypothetical protein
MKKPEAKFLESVSLQAVFMTFIRKAMSSLHILVCLVCEVKADDWQSSVALFR